MWQWPGALGLALVALAAHPLARSAQVTVVIHEHYIVHDGRVFVALDGPDGAFSARERAALPGRSLLSDDPNGERLTPFTPTWWLYVVCALSCVVTAAFAAGLTMGLVALDPMQLQITLHMDPKDCDNVEERRALVIDQSCAEKVYPIIENHHLLLVTLLLVNAGANETLPIFLDSLLPSWAAILVSVTFVLVFGEIIPSAIFTGPNQLRIAAALSPLVYALIAICSPVAYPISVALDHVLGDAHGSNAFKRQELRAIMKMQREQGTCVREPHGDNNIRRGSLLRDIWSGAGGHRGEGLHGHAANVLVSQQEDGTTEIGAALTDDELMIINGVLDIRNKKAADAMISLNDTFMLSMEDVLDSDTMARILAKGHSRIPVYRGWPHNVCGLILVKKLIVLSPEDKRKVSSLGLRYPLPVAPDTPLLELLNEFQRGMSHMAIVTNHPDLVSDCMRHGMDIPPHVHMDGIVTLEDILEQIIAEGINDETDDGVARVLSLAERTRERVRRVKTLAEQLRQRGRRSTTVGAVADVVRRSKERTANSNASSPRCRRSSRRADLRRQDSASSGAPVSCSRSSSPIDAPPIRQASSVSPFRTAHDTVESAASAGSVQAPASRNPGAGRQQHRVSFGAVGSSAKDPGDPGSGSQHCGGELRQPLLDKPGETEGGSADKP